MRTNTHQICLQDDARNINIFSALKEKNKFFGEFVEKQKIKDIFSSPPYIDLINYHEQHAYAYDLFGFARNDNSEIGSLFKGQGKEARNSYIEGVTKIFQNYSPFFRLFLKEFHEKNRDKL